MKRPRFRKQALCMMMSMAIAMTATPMYSVTAFAAGEDAVVTAGSDEITPGGEVAPGGESEVQPGGEVTPGGESEVQPGGEVTPGGESEVQPGGEVTPGGESEVQPGGEVTPGGESEVQPGGEVTPGGESEVQPGGEVTPGGEGEVQPGGEVTPGGEGEVQPGGEVTPGGEGEVQPGGEVTPGGEGEVQPGGEVTPGGEGEVQPGGEVTPGGEGEVQPGGEGETNPGEGQEQGEEETGVTDKVAVASVKAKINSIPATIELTDTCKEKIETARTAYDGLTSAQKELVPEQYVEKLENAEAIYKSLEDNAAANAVLKKIKAIGTVVYTDKCKNKIDAALAAYDDLTQDQQALIPGEKLDELLNAEKTYKELKADAEAVADVENKISEIRDVDTIEYSAACEVEISRAREAFDGLKEELKEKVSNLETLKKAEEKFEEKKIEKENADAVADVENKITAIGKVEYTPECKNAIKEARKAYDALKEELKENVTNYEELTKAEADYEVIRAEEEKVSKKFKDINGDEWFVDAVQYVYDREIMVGVGKNFKPNDSITREQFVQTLFNYCGKPGTDENGNGFSDIKMEWYVASVCWASQSGVISGFPDGKGGIAFGIGQNITREQLVVMLFNYAKIKGLDVTVSDAAIQGYFDEDVVDDWAKDAMNWAVSKGIISGKGKVGEEDKSKIQLAPTATATRAECAQIIKNFADNMQ